jgi:hypothetical protein
MHWQKVELGNKRTFPDDGNKEVCIKYDKNCLTIGTKQTLIELLENGWLTVQWIKEDDKKQTP